MEATASWFNQGCPIVLSLGELFLEMSILQMMLCVEIRSRIFLFVTVVLLTFCIYLPFGSSVVLFSFSLFLRPTLM